MKKHLFSAALLLLLGSTVACKSSEDKCIDESKIDPDRICTAEYDPVCGCDGKTYGNACEAERAGVTSYEKGACPESKSDVPQN